MKNPWMSLWLSAANRAGGTARSAWIAEAQPAAAELREGDGEGLDGAGDAEEGGGEEAEVTRPPRAGFRRRGKG